MSPLFLTVFSLLVSSALAAPITPQRFSARRNEGINTLQIHRRGTVSGDVGLGNNQDLLYTVPIQIGKTTTIVNLDTGSSDLWVISDECVADLCAKRSGEVPALPSASINKTGAQVTMRYGDSTTGTFAAGSIASDTVAIAGVAINKQLYAAIEDTTNSVVQFGATGIFGLGFPTGSQVQGAQVKQQFGNEATTDHFVAASYADGPLISRIVQTGELELPMFSISLQRSTIDIGGEGELTVGSLPEGIDNSSLTWVPVRLYTAAEGGINPPSFAGGETYPLRWEIDLDAVFLDGKQLASSQIPATGGVDTKRMSALIDTGNSLLRGPTDVVSSILSSISPTSFQPTVPNSALVNCGEAHNLAFQIGGKMFPIDPRDLIGPTQQGGAQTCVVDNVVATDAPSVGALFRWSLGDPFLKSNLVAFHYGNLTHPSVDPPRIGFMSLVPPNAAELLKEAVQDAVEDGGVFENTLVLAPTASIEAEKQVTVSVIPQGTVTAKPPPPANAQTTANKPAVTVGLNDSSSPRGAASRLGIWNPWLLLPALGALLVV